MHKSLADKFAGMSLRSTQHLHRMRCMREGDYHKMRVGRAPMVQVVLRVRPFSDRELAEEPNLHPVVAVHGRELKLSSARRKPRCYLFDACLSSCYNRAPQREGEAYEPVASQRDMFEQLGENLVEHLMVGRSAAVLLAYGQVRIATPALAQGW